MFNQFTGFLSGKPVGQRPRIVNLTHFHGPLYCAARAVHELYDSLLTAHDADRALRAVGELCSMAEQAGSPRNDLMEMTAWRDELAKKAELLRQASEDAERMPALSPVEVYINSGALPGRNAAPQRMSA